MKWNDMIWQRYKSLLCFDHMSEDKPITKISLIETLNEYGEKVLFPRVEQIVDDKMKGYTEQILESNDKVIKELKPLREEQAAVGENYKKLDRRVDNVEKFAEKSSQVTGVEFKRTTTA